MKLNSVRNIKQCEKGLYARQLQEYAQLCKIYAELAKISGKRLPSSIEHQYANALASAAKGDLSFTEKGRNFIIREDYAGPIYSEAEVELFEKYSEHAQILQTYKSALIKLEKIITESARNNGSINPDLVQDYHNFMQSPPNKADFVISKTKGYDTFVENGSFRYIGHRNYMLTRNAVSTITAIDKNHIAIPNFSEKATPERYGATLRNSTRRNVEFVVSSANKTFTQREAHEFSKPITPARETLEKGIVTANKLGKQTKRFYTKHRSAIHKTMAATLAVAALLTAGNTIKNAHEFSNLSATQNQQYEQTVSAETQNRLSSIRQSIEDLQTSNDVPSQEQMSYIRDELDEVIDDVVSDLVTTAFEEAMPGCTVQAIDTSYNRAEVENDGEKCEITYLDNEGKQHTTTIENFSTLWLAENPLSASFDNEYELDHKTPGKVNSIYNPTSPDNFVEKSEDVYSLLEYYKQILEDTEHLAGTKVVLKDGMILGLRLQTTLPEKQKAQTEPSTSPNHDANFYPSNDPLAQFENNQNNLNDDGRDL